MRASHLFSAVLASLALSACASSTSPQAEANAAAVAARQAAPADAVAPVTPPPQPAARTATEPVQATPAQQAAQAAQTPPATEAAPAAAQQPAAQAPARKLPRVSLKTTMGEIVIELEQDKAPKTVDNFLKYVKSGFYNGLIFQRVEKGFVIQAGGYDSKLVPRRTRKPIVNEAGNGLSNGPYTVAMARQDAPNSATSQFFINLANNAGLDRENRMDAGYAVFGRVVEGQAVVDKIADVVVDDKPGFANVPVVPIVIKSAKVVKVK